jgi:hypothetical protein
MTSQRDPRSGPIMNKNINLYTESSFLDNKNLNYETVSSQLSSSCSANTLMQYRHFILNRSRSLMPAEVHTAAADTFGKSEYKVKRIRKDLFKYVRISISKSLTNDTIENGIKLIASKLEVKAREQSLNRRPDLESSSNGVSQLSSVMTLNINGIKSKTHELMMLLQRCKPDIICLQETKKMVNDKRIHLNGYLVHDVPSDGTGAGLAIGFRKGSGLSCNVIESSQDVILASVSGADSNVIVGNIYRSPDPERMKETTMKVVGIFKTYFNKSNCLLVGDWNETPNVLTSKLLKKGVQVYAPGAPIRGTRVFKNRKRTERPIDFGLTNSSQLVASQCTRSCWMISDHLPVEIRLNLGHREHSLEKVTVFDRKRLNEPHIAEAIKNQKIDLTGLDPLSGITTFHTTLVETLKRLNVIREEKPREDFLIIPDSVKRAINLKRQTDKAVREVRATLAELEEARKSVSRAVADSRRRSYMRSIKRGIDHLKNNDSRNAWKWVRTQSGRTRSKLNLDLVYKPDTQIPETDAEERLKIWANHFKKLSVSGPEGAAQSEITEANKEISLITDEPITWPEISSVLKAMRKGKAAGSDLVPGEVYKLVEAEPEPSSQLAKSMLELLKSVYDGGGFPLEWRDCTVVPIFKKGDRLDPNNYRGISLINILLKVITKILAARLQVVCNTFSLLKREQVGFIQGEEGVSQAACLLESCQRRKIRGNNTILCFLDLRKAYDLVPHERLFYKLKKFGLGDKMVNFIRRMYDNTYMRVRVNNRLTEPFKYERGVRQGCPTSPLLFNIYINDILDNISPLAVEGLEHGLRGLMFADDTIILAESHSDLSDKLSLVNNWMGDNAMEVNPSKCGIMEIHPSLPIEPVLFNGEEIPKVNTYVYLGIEFNNMLDINLMSKYRIDKGKNTLRLLTPTLRNAKVPLEYRIMLIKSILIPTIHYGSEVFGMNEARVNSLKCILDNGLKCIVKRSNFCRVRAYQEFDIKPIYISAAESRARGLKKWTEANGLISDCIQSQEFFKSKLSTWIKESKRWLKLMKIDISLPSQELIEQVHANRTRRVLERDRSVIGQWANRLQITSGQAIRKAEIMQACRYTGINAITKLRTGTFLFTNQLVRLQILPGTYRNKCVCCGTEEVEDVEHLLLSCTKFSSFRESCIPSLNGKDLTPESARISLLKRLLGEERLTSGRKTNREVLEVCRYLSHILPLRSGIVAECKEASRV